MWKSLTLLSMTFRDIYICSIKTVQEVLLVVELQAGGNLKRDNICREKRDFFFHSSFKYHIYNFIKVSKRVSKAAM
jgi:hypothetical protein